MRINTNIPALQSYNALSATNNALQKSIERLSTGLRINSAADDAAGLAISEKMRAQYRGLDQAVRNSQDGISMIQTAEGALNETHSILQRMRELSVQAANDTLTGEDRSYIQLEIDRIASTTQFNRKKLLDGSADAVWSVDEEGIWVDVRGTLASRDIFGQKIAQDGNYKVTVAAEQGGQGQVLKSNIFRHATSDSPVAGVASRLQDLANFVDTSGNFILDSPQTLTISLEGGSSAAVTVYAGDTLGSLGEKLAAALGAATGGVAVQEGSTVQFVGDEFGVASDDDTVAYLLASNWLEGAVRRISDVYGISGTGKTLVVTYTDDPAATDGAVHYDPAVDPDKVYMILKRSTFDPDNASFPSGLAGLIGHEMVHAVLSTDPRISAAIGNVDGSGMWLAEGLTEYLRGTNYNVQALGSVAAVEATVSTVLGFGGGANYQAMYQALYGGAGGANNYNGAYLAVRYFDEESIKNGGTGIKGLLAELQKGVTMNAAMNTASGGLFTNLSALQTSLLGSNFIAGVLAENPAIDTGAIGGLYASGGAPLTVDTVMPSGTGLKGNPLAAYGWAGVDLSGVMSAAQPSTLARSEAMDGTLQSVAGTLLLHSPLVGSAGRITISGDDRLLQALGFAEVQEAKEAVYRISIADAHTGSMLASSVRMSGNTIYSVLHENVDIYLGNNFGLSVDGQGTLADGYGSFRFGNAGLSSFVVHLASTATSLQIGANEGEDFTLSFGDMGARALGVNNIKVTGRESAARSITLIDRAISRVSSQRARLGAYQNRLEHTIANLTTASTNMKSSESRIRDTDMAKEMMNFTKLSILSQAGSSILAQANQLPQSALQLLR